MDKECDWEVFVMKVCYFGSYSQSPRNRIIMKGLKQNSIEVVECRDTSNIFLRYPKLMKKYFGLRDLDAIIIGEPGQTSVLLARILINKTEKPLIFDAYLSLYEMMVYDRKLVKENSFKAKYFYYLDKIPCKLADVVLLDTNEHINYFNEEFGINKDKFRRVFIGADTDIFYPRQIEKENNDQFTVLFHGSFIPLQGIQYIIKAAKILEKYTDINFEIIGKGQTFNEMIKLSKSLNSQNITFMGSIKYEEIPNYIARADIGLGIFGDTDKAKRVIPNKAYEIIAMKKPLITGDSPAARELFVNGKNAILCKMADPESIAESILCLKEDDNLRRKIAKNGYNLFREKASPNVIGQDVKKNLESLVYQ